MVQDMIQSMIRNITIDELLSSDSVQKIRQMIDVISSVQKGLCKLASSEDSAQLNLLKIGTVFQIFFIDVLASGKQPGELTEEDWKDIANIVCQYAVMEEGQRYSEFVFTLYADYISISVETLRGMVSSRMLESIQDRSDTIRQNTERLRQGEITETSYIEACLWLALEAMIKLLSAYFTIGIPEEYADVLQSIPQLALEYGRYVLYAKEQAILTEYIQNQRVLDEQLEEKYKAYLEDVQTQADSFRQLVEGAFSADVSETLLKSAALARAAGVEEEELLTTVEDVDAFFLD